MSHELVPRASSLRYTRLLRLPPDAAADVAPDFSELLGSLDSRRRRRPTTSRQPAPADSPYEAMPRCRHSTSMKICCARSSRRLRTGSHLDGCLPVDITIDDLGLLGRAHRRTVCTHRRCRGAPISPTASVNQLPDPTRSGSASGPRVDRETLLKSSTASRASRGSRESMQSVKVVVTGPFNAGKTTFISPSARSRCFPPERQVSDASGEGSGEPPSPWTLAASPSRTTWSSISSVLPGKPGSPSCGRRCRKECSASSLWWMRRNPTP